MGGEYEVNRSNGGIPLKIYVTNRVVSGLLREDVRKMPPTIVQIFDDNTIIINGHEGVVSDKVISYVELAPIIKGGSKVSRKKKTSTKN